jgi:hypothetical protein
MLKPIIVCSLVAVVILAECVLAWLLIPSTADVEAWAKEKTAATATASRAAKDEKVGGLGHDSKTAEHGHAEQPKHHEKAAHGEHGGHGDADASHDAGGHDAAHHEIEHELGKFSVVIHDPAASSTMRINFYLIGILGEEQHKEFEELLAKNQHRLRDQVIFEIRNSRVEDLTDPGLGLLKRKILAKTNDLLGKPLLRTVVFSDFAFVEQ